MTAAVTVSRPPLRFCCCLSAPRCRGLLMLLGILVCLTPTRAQDLGLKAPPQRQPILLVNAHLHLMYEKPIPHGWMIFDHGIIQGVGLGPPPVPFPGAQVIDVGGRHVYPGLIASSTQLGLAEIAAVRATNDFREVGQVTPEVRAAVAINPDSTLIPVTRSNGILTAAVFPEGGRIAGRVSVVRLEGWTWEEMTILDDAGLAVQWPVMRTIVAPWMERSEQEQGDDVRRALDEINDAFRTARAYLSARAADPALPIDLRWESMRSVFPPAPGSDATPLPRARLQRPVFVAAQDVDQISAAVALGAEHGLRIVIVGGRDAPLVADLLLRHNVPVIITGTHTFPRRADSPYDDAFTLPARLHAAGVKFAIASADRTAHERNLPYNAATAVAFGLDHEAAIKSLTLWAAEILGVDHVVGSLQPGREATFIITDGSPLEITTKIERAFIAGREIDLSNKQTHLAAKYRERYRQRDAASSSTPARHTPATTPAGPASATGPAPGPAPTPSQNMPGP